MIVKPTIAGILVAGCLLLPKVGTAADSQGQFGVRGAGLVSCALYVKAREARSEVYEVVAGWMDGYITGVNQYADNTYDVASFESTELLAAMVNEYCKKHADTPVFPVVNSLVKRFLKNRLTSPSHKITIDIDNRKVSLYREVVRRLQRQLAAGGFYDGPINGTYGKKVENGMAAFQKSINLKPTGFPDQLTLWRLFNGDQ